MVRMLLSFFGVVYDSPNPEISVSGGQFPLRAAVTSEQAPARLSPHGWGMMVSTHCGYLPRLNGRGATLVYGLCMDQKNMRGAEWDGHLAPLGRHVAA